MILKWDKRFLELADFISKWSKDPSTKVGAVIVNSNKQIISVGYNGLPKNIKDTEEILNNRELKYQMIVHAERNALLFANNNLNDCTLYTYPFMPCPVCAGMIIQSGIFRVVSYKNYDLRWEESFKISRKMFKESGIKLMEYHRQSGV